MSERSSTPTDAVIELAGVVRSYGGIRALDGVDCAFDRASLTAIVGPNGSGKSTIVRAIAGAIGVDAGSVRVLGVDPRARHGALRAQLGYVGQGPALDPEITGRETLQLFHALRGLSHRDRERCLARVIAETGLESFCDRVVAGYSGGQRQRLHLAVETLHEPRILLLDEPTSGLDPAGRAELWERLLRLRSTGHTVVIVTHDLAEVEAHAERVVIMRQGAIAADGSPVALVAAYGICRTTIVIAEPPSDSSALGDALTRAIDQGRVSIDGTTITIERGHAVEGTEPALETLRNLGSVVMRFEQRPRDLVSAYGALTGAAGEARAERRHAGRVPGSGGGRGRR
jgi:ABC-type multidrug transport system ATPase subunit